MNALQILSYDASADQFPEKMRPSLRGNLHLASIMFSDRKVSSTIRLVVAAPPIQRPGRSIFFHAFATNRTSYGAIEALESLLADWFLETRVLPIINPIPMKYYEEPNLLPKEWYSTMVARGVRIYSYAT